MKCPHCHRQIFVSTQNTEPTFEQRIKRTLQFMAQENQPLFGGLIRRDVVQEEADIVYMLANDLIEPIEDKGFVLTDKGRKLISS